MQILDEGGAVSKQYLWLEAGSMGDNAGWYDDDFNYVEEPIKPGQSVLISTENEGVTITFAGSVGQTDIVLSSISGFNFVGNATPISTDIQKITLSGAQISEWSDSIQFLDDGGAVEKQYLWLEAGSMGDNAGWYDDDFNYVAEAVEAGNGFLISTENAGVTITIPAAL